MRGLLARQRHRERRALVGHRGGADGAAVALGDAAADGQADAAALVLGAAVQALEQAEIERVVDAVGEQLEAVDHVCEALDGTSVSMLPLVDDAKQRMMVKEAFKGEVSETSSHLVTRMKEMLNSDDPVTAKEYNSVLQEYTEAKKRLDLYGDILSSEKSYVESSLEIVNFQLQSLLEKD